MAGSLPAQLHVSATRGDDANSGLSWNDPKRTIQAAIDAASTSAESDVFIEKGEYQENILMATGVSVTGGFEGFEPSESARVNPYPLATVIRPDNGPHVVNFTNVQNAELRSVRITGGNANGSQESFDARGGGIIILSSDNIFIDACMIDDNTASVSGGGLYAQDSAPVIRNTVFAGNMTLSPADGGGGIGTFQANGTVVQSCVFFGNLDNSAGVGAAIDVYDSSVTVLDSIFAENNDQAIYIFSESSASSAALTNNLFFNNTGAPFVFQDSSGTQTFTTAEAINGFAGNAGNLFGDPQFIAPERLYFGVEEGSPAINAASSPSNGRDYLSNFRGFGGDVPDIGAFERSANIDGIVGIGAISEESGLPLQAGNRFGDAMASVGDLDGNGTDDLLVQVSGAKNEAGEPTGVVALIYTDPGNLSIRGFDLVAEGTVPNGRFGQGLTGIALGGQGIFVIGDPSVNEERGTIYTVSSGFGQTGDLQELPLAGLSAGEEFGSSVIFALPVGDSQNLHLLIGAPGADNETGRVVLVEVVNQTLNEVLSIGNGNGFAAGQLQPGDRFGQSIASGSPLILLDREATDLTFFVGAPGTDNSAGAVWEISINSSGEVSTPVEVVLPEFSGRGHSLAVFESPKETAGFERLLAVGSPTDSNSRGRFAIVGSSEPFLSSTDTIDDNTNVGSSLAWLPDNDFNGYPDLAVSFPGFNEERGGIVTYDYSVANEATAQGRVRITENSTNIVYQNSVKPIPVTLTYDNPGRRSIAPTFNSDSDEDLTLPAMGTPPVLQPGESATITGTLESEPFGSFFDFISPTAISSDFIQPEQQLAFIGFSFPYNALELTDTSDPGNNPEHPAVLSMNDEGSRLVFSSSINPITGIEEGVAQIYLADFSLSSSQQIRKLTDGASESFYPAISGDGTKVVFVSQSNHLSPPAVFDAPQVWHLDLSAAPGNGFTLLFEITSSDTIIQAPALDQDGSIVAFQASASGSGPIRSFNLYRYDFNGPSFSQLTANGLSRTNLSNPATVSLAETGNPIFFANAGDLLDIGEDTTYHEIWRYDASAPIGSRITRVTNTRELDPAQRGDSLEPFVRRTGDRILFSSTAQFDDSLVAGISNIYLWDVSPGAEKQITRVSNSTNYNTTGRGSYRPVYANLQDESADNILYLSDSTLFPFETRRIHPGPRLYTGNAEQAGGPFQIPMEPLPAYADGTIAFASGKESNSSFFLADARLALLTRTNLRQPSNSDEGMKLWTLKLSEQFLINNVLARLLGSDIVAQDRNQDGIIDAADLIE